MSDKLPLRWKLCAYFMVFSVFILSILWIIQTFLLDNLFYLYERISVENNAKIIEENIDNAEIDLLLASLSQENGFSIYILSEDGTLKKATEHSANVKINKASPVFYEYWDLARENGGTYVLETVSSGITNDSGDLFEDLFEYDPSHFYGKVPEEISSRSITYSSEIHSADGEAFLLTISSRISPSTPMVNVFKLILIVTSVFSLSVSLFFAFIASKGLASPIKDLANSIDSLVAGDPDVVFSGSGCLETVHLGNTLNAAAQKLRKTESLRKELLANVSHDLRTPLTMIGGYGEMMRDIPGENNAENIQIIIDETHRLTKLVNDALDLSKLQSGNYNLHPTVFSVTDEAFDIVTQFEKLSAGKSRISFIRSCDVFVKADETLISEAIYNLVNNAVKHSGENSSVTVRQSVNEKTVRISVIDNGCGIAEDDLKDIWERYQKGSRSGGGTGLGLPIVKSAVLLCGGTCGVISNLGSGSEFWIELPIYKE